MLDCQCLSYPRCAAVLLAGLLAGCSGSDTPQFERYSPERAAEVAMETYDANGDGKIAGGELDKCLALKYAMPRVDTITADKSVSPDEIAKRMQALESQSRGMSAVVQVLSNGRPLSGATVTMTLEPFMGTDPPTYVVTTDETGGGVPLLQGSDQPSMSIPLGFYRISISAPGEAAEVVRGCEVADDSPTSNRLVFSLQDEAPVSGGRSGGR